MDVGERDGGGEGERNGEGEGERGEIRDEARGTGEMKRGRRTERS